MQDAPNRIRDGFVIDGKPYVYGEICNSRGHRKLEESSVGLLFSIPEGYFEYIYFYILRERGIRKIRALEPLLIFKNSR